MNEPVLLPQAVAPAPRFRRRHDCVRVLREDPPRLHPHRCRLCDIPRPLGRLRHGWG